jgi:hypothetical protein
MFEKSGVINIPEENTERKNEKILNKVNHADQQLEEGFSPERRRFLFDLLAASLPVAGLAMKNSFERFGIGMAMFKKASDSLKVKLAPKDEILKVGDNSRFKASEDFLDYNKGNSMEITLETAGEIEKYWKNKYLTDPKLSNSLYGAYYKMEKDWTPALRDIFKERGVPEKYLYLAIPESHWDRNAKSHAGALGPYQFTEWTGRKYELIDKLGNDYRKDEIESAKACAQCLKDLYDKTKDWDLALAGYNGGFIWGYIKKCKLEKIGMSYAGFLSYLSKKVGLIKEEIRRGKIIHEVSDGESLIEIAARYGIGHKKLMHDNGLKKDRIKEGQRLIIVLNNEELKKETYTKLVKGIKENLDYPPKFNAVFELIEDGILISSKTNENNQS